MKRLVIKVGSSIISNGDFIAMDRIKNLAIFLNSLRQKYQIILVSSGAVASGYTKLCLDKSKLENKQALAAIGQPLLINAYQKVFDSFGIFVSQLLLTGYDFDSRINTEYASKTIEVLLKNNVLPIINENDSTAINELTFGDNDRLSAYVAYYFGADMLVILSDIAGYYDSDPHENKNAHLLKIVHQIPQEKLISHYNPHGNFATGGIVTKLLAADFLLQKNKSMFLCNGLELEDAGSFLLQGIHKSGTLFIVKDEKGQ
ncbi:glutamate 5-kinase [Helicobacter sp. 11S03491-1]|uniref:glutamate 5-kinase n=1 Tax=Helicobacter sp. 11S03491-1 TaxID=1476196 RepID=UPI000BA754AB|nr:glutamate 5-kinase [Helicobacter sp. 11S03491-1]PAF41864.1 glutamate 5-kinase [Helicobacter sp. 11S03491-1]